MSTAFGAAKQAVLCRSVSRYHAGRTDTWTPSERSLRRTVCCNPWKSYLEFLRTMSALWLRRAVRPRLGVFRLDPLTSLVIVMLVR